MRGRCGSGKLLTCAGSSNRNVMDAVPNFENTGPPGLAEPVARATGAHSVNSAGAFSRTAAADALTSWAHSCAAESAHDTTAARRLQAMARAAEQELDADDAAEQIRSARQANARERERALARLPLVIRWREALKVSAVPSTRRWVLVALSLYAQTDGTGAYPSTRRLAGDTALSRRSVEEHLRIAEGEGWIRREDRQRTGRALPSKRYVLTIPLHKGNGIPLHDSRVGESGARVGEPHARVGEAGSP